MMTKKNKNKNKNKKLFLVGKTKKRKKRTQKPKSARKHAVRRTEPARFGARVPSSAVVS
jgi:hypothetical protein